MRKSLLHQVVLAVFLSGCAADNPATSERTNIPGSNKDAHGCISSAGYSWCERTNQCERLWELTERAGFDNNQDEYEKYCKEKP